MQAGLDDGAWHSFEGTATPTELQLVVDGVEGHVAAPSDERGNQTVKAFGRVETRVNYVIGKVPITPSCSFLSDLQIQIDGAPPLRTHAALNMANRERSRAKFGVSW